MREELQHIRHGLCELPFPKKILISSEVELNVFCSGAEKKTMAVDFKFGVFSRWPQSAYLAVCVHLGWYLMVKEAALSQRPVLVFIMASPTTLVRPLGWTATPGKGIQVE